MERTVTIGLEEYLSLRDQVRELKERAELLSRDIPSVLVVVEAFKAKRYTHIQGKDELLRKIIDENNELIKENKDLKEELDCVKEVNKQLTLRLANKEYKISWFNKLFQ